MTHRPLLTRHNVKVSGNPQAARSLVFVHGFGTDRTVWDGITPAFEDRWRIVTFDNAGAGAADPAAFVQHRYLGLNGYADDLLQLCRDLELADACVVGHSAGGMIAALATLAEPRRFSALVMLGASPRYLDDAGYVGGFTEADLQAIYSRIVGGFQPWVDQLAATAMGNADRPELARQFAQTLGRVPPERALTVLCSILQSDHRADVERITQPTLIVQSREDVFVPGAVARFLHERIRGSRLAEIDASGHFPQLSAPAEVIGALRTFLERQS